MKKFSLLIFLIFSLGLFLRIINLTTFPIFTDETIYLYWAKKISQGDFSPFMPLWDGKTFLYIWLNAFILKFNLNYLLAGRIISVFSFIITFFFLYLIGKKIISTSVNLLIILFIYALNPYNLFFERMALMDSLLTSFSLMMIYFITKNINKKPSLLLSFFSGIFLTFAFLTKPTAKVFLASLLIFWFLNKTESLKQKILNAFVNLLPIYFILHLLTKAKAYGIFKLKTQEFIYPLNTNFKILLNNFGKNLLYIFESYNIYFGVFFIILFILGVFYFLKEKNNFFFKIIIPFFIFPLLIISLYAKIIFSRYILFLSPLIIIILAMGISYLKNYSKLLFYFVFFYLIGYFLIGSWAIISGKENLKLPKNELNQYIYHQPSGFGTKELLNFLKNQLDKKPFLVITDANFGLFPYLLELEFEKEKEIKIVGTWKFDEEFIKQIKEKIKKDNIRQVYFVFNENPPEKIKTLPLSIRPIKEIYRPKNMTAIRIYEFDFKPVN